MFDSKFFRNKNIALEIDPINLRNKVTHQGYVPTYEQALEYAQGVQEYIRVFANEYFALDLERSRIRQEAGELSIFPSRLGNVNKLEHSRVKNQPDRKISKYINTFIRVVAEEYRLARVPLVDYIKAL